MSGLLRRIKRSRPADAGEPHPEGRAAETEGAATTAETPPAAPEETRADASEATTQIVAPVDEAAVGTTPAGEESEAGAAADQPATTGVGAPKRTRWRPLRRRAREIPPATLTPAPVLQADPNVPAGVDPAAAPMRPPAGRRGRLRRRLRYLRRARELMLRDLGGLLYEIHRTGGGNVDAHATVVGAKVQRIAGLDAEAHALETALAAPRAETVVFEPGVGGTCATCGELYGSDARFCANCGTPIGAAPEARAPETGHEVVAPPARRAFWRRAARPARGDDAVSAEQAATAAGEATAAAGDKSGDQTAAETRVEAPTESRDEAASAGDDSGQQTAVETRDEAGATGEASAQQPAEPRPEAARDAETATQPRDEGAAKDDDPHNPHSSGRNGRPEERKAPGLSSGDPLFSRERS